MKFLAFATRNVKEIIRDKLSLFFGIGFPLLLLIMFSVILGKAPVDMFKINVLTPGIAAFGYAFISLFSALLIAKDRNSSFMLRLLTSPMTAGEFIAGYFVPLIPIAVVQSLVCFAAALFMGLDLSVNILLSVVVLIPAALIYISIGLIGGTLLDEKQAGGVIGGLVTNFSAWLSGIWFDIDLIGGTFKKVTDCLPFSHSVDAARAALNGNYGDIMPHLWWVIGYAVVLTVIAILIFRLKMKKV